MTIGPQILDMPGKRFGRLTVLREAPPRITEIGQRRLKMRRFECKCDCGKVVTANMKCLRGGNTQSCGCLNDRSLSKGNLKHGDAKIDSTAAEYTAWYNMRARCEHPNHNSFANYGGRGISICARWRNGEDGKSGYECFLADMGRKPTLQHSLDRYPDNDGNYQKDNCRWATATEQANNRRPRKRVAA